jgi:NAD(P)-dependent dehydrogenase (short-subunit alcohol dehydrogenase family)/rhamnose utilization protein RhaD (predicted bifunctional aldolase and dehydrogenase)
MSVLKLCEMSNKYGSNPEYVLAGGGNTSFKDDEFLYVKGSGTSLATIDESGFVKLERSKLNAIFTSTYPKDDDEREAAVLKDMMNARAEGETKRPSVETVLHNVYPTALVLHLHPGMVNGMTCGKGWKVAFDKLFAKDSIWTPPIMPGYILSVKVKDEIANFEKTNGKKPSYLFLENHGVFTGADTLEEVDKLFDELLVRINSEIKVKPDFSECAFDTDKAVAIAPAIRVLTSGDSLGVAVFVTNKDVMSYVSSAEQFSKVSPAFTPDHMVYCRDKALFIEAEETEAIYTELQEKLKVYKTENGGTPKIIAVKNLGYYACGGTKKEADIAASVFLDAVKVAVYSQSFGGGKPMPTELVDSINNWEVERYRKSVSFSSGASKRLNGKISIVTGSAQGFGKGIAEDMAADGSYIGVADLNEAGALEVAQELCAANGEGCAIGIKVNVANEVDVKAMVANMVLNYGGLDIYVNNAGIVRAGTVDEMDVKSFDLVTNINYTAYFIGVKYTSKIMKIQNRFNKKLFMDIIQINSKSGLSGSNKNFAYAGSKFGGIGLTQSFALELCEYHIKVNSICPGNFLDGPLWCDPDKGLFVQYLKTGKVPGAKTIDDVKRSYESKVPMNRGCVPLDVSRAICYCVEQEYETGQAIPITGGQEMLK